jgi:hypothetical protein
MTSKLADAQFRFDVSLLKRLNGNDYLAIERVLDRIPSLPAGDETSLVAAYASQLARKLAVETPPVDQRQQFLEDLLAAEIRRQDRALAVKA